MGLTTSLPDSPLAAVIITVSRPPAVGQPGGGGESRGGSSGSTSQPGAAPSVAPSLSGGDDGGIRPLSLPPNTNAVAASQYDPGSGSGGSGGSGGQGYGEQEPTMYFAGEASPNRKEDGTYIDVISDQVTVTVAAGYGSTLSTITWQIDGGLQGQTYSESTGYVNTPLPSSVVQSLATGTTKASFTFYWDNQEERVHEIKAAVDQKLPSGSIYTRNKTISVDVQPPNVQEFRMTQQAQQFRTTSQFGGEEQIGFMQFVETTVDGKTVVTPGDVLTAKVDTPADPLNKASSFAVIQVVTGMNVQYDQQSGVRLSLKVANTVKLDKGDRQTNFLNDIDMGPFAAGQVGIRLPQDAPLDHAFPNGPKLDPAALDDSPTASTPTAAYIQPNADWVVRINQDIKFRDYLMYRATDKGLWVGISQLDWSVKGTAVLKPEQNPNNQRFLAYYGNPDNWTKVGLAPAPPKPILGTNGYFVPKWNGVAPTKYSEGKWK